jgi:hypothetical protein
MVVAAAAHASRRRHQSHRRRDQDDRRQPTTIPTVISATVPEYLLDQSERSRRPVLFVHLTLATQSSQKPAVASGDLVN